jgi:methylase of polypeptide subunit release factors
VLLPGERFPLVIADPPWVPGGHTGRFPDDPLLAIDGGSDGMDVIRICVLALELHLAAQGVALLQLGSSAQAEQVAELVRGGRLQAAEVREFERGVVLRLDAHDA